MNKNLNKKSIFVLSGLLLIAVFFTFSFFPKKRGVEKGDFLDCENCNIIIISMTSTRTDHLNAYGYNKNTAPHISELAEQGIMFTNVFTQASRTVAAGLSLLTSQYPYSHGVLDQWYSKEDLNPDSKILAEILREKGYKTAAFVGGGHYKGILGFNKGFDTYQDSQDFIGFGPNVPEVVDWLNGNKNNKFFLFLQGFDAHCPYFPPSPYDTMFDPDYENKNNIDYSVCYWSYKGTKPVEKEGEKKFPLHTVINWGGTTIGNLQEEWQEELFNERDIEHLIALYDGSIAYADYQVGKILKTLRELKLDDNTIIVFTADHGELFGEQDRFMRGGYLTGTYNDAVLRIPLIMKYPKMKEKKQIGDLVQIIDIVPTLLESLDIPTYKEAQGRSLLPLIKSDKEVNEYIYAGTSQFREKSYRHFFTGINEVDVIRNKEWKLIRETAIDYDQDTTTVEYELYQIKEDPKELNNLFKEQPSIANNLKEKLQEWILKTKKSTATDETKTEKVKYVYKP